VRRGQYVRLGFEDRTRSSGVALSGGMGRVSHLLMAHGTGSSPISSLAEVPQKSPDPSVLVVGRHGLFAEALAVNLRDIGFEVVGTVRDATAVPLTSPPDVGVVDLGSDGARGLDPGPRLLRRWSEMKLLALASEGDHFAPRSAYTEGYHGCLSKEAPLSRLAASIRAVFAGDTVFYRDNGGSGRRSRNGRSARTGGRARNLTPRELEVLTLLVQGRRSSEIAESLNIGLNTVRTHVQNILTKLHVHSRLEAASVAVKYGLVPLRRDTSRPVIPPR
jgi:two-component system nitrate/nitrite response regulator NarL